MVYPSEKDEEIDTITFYISEDNRAIAFFGCTIILVFVLAVIILRMESSMTVKHYIANINKHVIEYEEYKLKESRDTLTNVTLVIQKLDSTIPEEYVRKLELRVILDNELSTLREVYDKLSRSLDIVKTYSRNDSIDFTKYTLTEEQESILTKAYLLMEDIDSLIIEFDNYISNT